MIVKQLVPELIVEDVERTLRFYKEKLGFDIVAQAPENGKPSWAEMVNGSARLMVQGKEETLIEMPLLSSYSIGGTTLLVLRIDGQNVVRNLWSQQTDWGHVILPLRETEYGTVEFGIADPDGYVLIFSSQ